MVETALFHQTKQCGQSDQETSCCQKKAKDKKTNINLLQLEGKCCTNAFIYIQSNLEAQLSSTNLKDIIPNFNGIILIQHLLPQTNLPYNITAKFFNGF